MVVDAALEKAARWRMIGPHRGGRVVAVAGDPVDDQTFYFGACGGGVWKTTDAGTYWQPLTDGQLNTAAIGALAVADADPNVLYAGTGEACIRGNVIHGDGVYRSTDAGRTWTHRGLPDSRHISRIRIHPKDADLVYVAALGHAFGPNEERGVYRSKDGGGSWERVLFKSERAGACDLALDPTNPRVLFAALWDVKREPWGLTSGGPDSGLWRSTDGGDTWAEITENEGLPKGLKGRIGVAVSPAQRGRVWALVEAEAGGLFRSDDGGDTWERISEDRDLRQRPWYYMHVFADPRDPNTCYILNLKMWKSTDGGRTFTAVTTPHGDNHELWIDPKNPRRMIEGNDGGACVSFNGGDTWSTIYNQPTSQFYHVTTDTRFPYHVYGTQQDNSAICVPSHSAAGAIPWGECYPVGSSESGHIQVRPDDPNVVYSGAIGSAPGGGGALLRYDHGTKQTRIITVYPEAAGGYGAKDMKYRFQWTYPILISPHDPNLLYVTGNHVFRSTDEGTSWEPISPDLTRNDESKLGPSGGPITRDTTGAEHYCTIFAFAESPHEQGVFWAGSDDGLLHRSADDGATWQDVTPPDLDEWTTICTIELSPHDPAVVYVAATRYKLDDFRPLLWTTDDNGASWTRISDGLPEGEITRVIREDPRRRGLLFVGGESGVYVSDDNGESWQSLRGNMPAVPVHDLQIKDADLVAATHGRSFWILDDLGPWRQMSREIAEKPAHVFQGGIHYRTRPLPGAGRPSGTGKNYSFGLGAAVTYTEKLSPTGEVERTMLDAGENRPAGLIVNYLLKEAPKGDITLTVLDGQGAEVKTFSSKKPEKAAPAPQADEADIAASGEEGGEGVETAEATGESEPEEQYLTKDAGANRFVWNLRYPDAVKVEGDKTTEQGTLGPVAVPGIYTVRLTVDGYETTGEFEIRKDPRVRATQEDLDAQFELHSQIRDKLTETHTAINRLRDLKAQVESWRKRAGDDGAAKQVAAAARDLAKRLEEVEEELIQPRVKGQLDSIHYPTKLNAKLATLQSVVTAADAAPPRAAYEVFADLSQRIDTQLERLNQIVEGDVAGFNRTVQEAALPAVQPTS